MSKYSICCYLKKKEAVAEDSHWLRGIEFSRWLKTTPVSVLFSPGPTWSSGMADNLFFFIVLSNKSILLFVHSIHIRLAKTGDSLGHVSLPGCIKNIIFQQLLLLVTFFMTIGINKKIFWRQRVKNWQSWKLLFEALFRNSSMLS